MWYSTIGGIITLILCLLATPGAVTAQPEQHVPRIGFLSGGTPVANAARVAAFRQGLRELGYVEGHNLVMEWRYAEGQLERLPALAAELVRLEVDVIVTAAPGPTRAAKAATATIPIVMAYDSDPVGNGFVASLAQPGGTLRACRAWPRKSAANNRSCCGSWCPGSRVWQCSGCLTHSTPAG
jgi:ABC-type uncharacterized transport system substrate-binding protein